MAEILSQYGVQLMVAAVLFWVVWMKWIGPKIAGVKNMSATEYASFRHNEHTVVDVRSASEFASGHAEAALNIPLNKFLASIDKLDRERSVVVICASGNRSAVAATQLAKAGFKDVYNFSGGMAAWEAADLPVR